MKKNNVGSFKVCYGCGVCATICPTKIIKITLNPNGFLTPSLTSEEKCINCGLCLRICAYNHQHLEEKNIPIKSYGGWSRDEKTRRFSSSGGVSIEILKKALENDYSACSVQYDPNAAIAQHFITTEKEELYKSLGSKYIQSHTQPAFSLFENNKKYIVVGTPCQIDSLRRYVKLKRIKDNFIFIDFFCHGVPSYLAWTKYLRLVQKKIGSISFINWRNKLNGWHDSWAIGANSNPEYKIELQNGEFCYYSKLSDGDIFYNLFLGDYCMNPACCKSCKYKYDKSSADIRIGDFWGKTYKTDEKGVSAVVIFTKVGEDIISSLSEVCELQPYPFKQVAEGQMKKNAHPSIFAPLVMKMLKSKKELNTGLLKLLFLTRFIYYIPIRIYSKLSGIFPHEK